jgi:hypothetical protein
MTTNKRPKRITYTSPSGVFKYPSLSSPDYGNEAYPKPDGEFKTGLVVPMADAQDLIKKLMPEWDKAIELGKIAFDKLDVKLRKKFGSLTEQMFYETEYDSETEEPTGNVIFKFKTKYKITDKKTGDVRFNKIGLFDSKGKPLPPGTAIYGGTLGKIAFQTSDYFVAGQGMAGISLRLSAAQVIELVGPGNRSASSFGFGEEDGYEADDTAEETMPDDSGTQSQGANGDPDDF